MEKTYVYLANTIPKHGRSPNKRLCLTNCITNVCQVTDFVFKFYYFST